MSITDVRKDAATCTLTVTSEWPAAVEKVWQLWADPRKLERWWGPPVYPATVTQHELQSGGTVRYFMTGPEGGFETEEVQLARESGFRICTLGPRILRCETAPLCALTAVLYDAGALD